MPGGRPKEFDEEAVLETAMELFWQRGYRGLGLAELVRHMGISRQSLYDTFGSKRGLFIRAIEQYRTTHLARGLALLEARRGSSLQRVKNLVAFFEELAADRRCRGCLVANAVVELGGDDPEVAALLQEILGQIEDAVYRCLLEARWAGELAPGKSPRQLSRALTNAMIGMAVSGKLPLGPTELRSISSGTLRMLD